MPAFNLLTWKCIHAVVVFSLQTNSIPPAASGSVVQTRHPKRPLASTVTTTNFRETTIKSQENESEKPQTATRNTLRLTVSADPSIFLPEKPITLSWKVVGQNDESPQSNIKIRINLPYGLFPISTLAGSQKISDSVFIFPWEPDSTEILLQPIKGITSPLIIGVELIENTKKIESQTVELFDVASEITKNTGGLAQDSTGRVSLKIDKEAVDEDLLINVRPPAAYKQPAFSLSWNPVEIVAVGKTSGKNITSFKRPIPITMKYDRNKIIKGREDDLIIFYYDEYLRDWLGLETTVNKKKQELTAFTDHLTVFDYKAESWQGFTAPTVDNFKSDGFTGSATYNYPIWTPPGTAGLKPEISLSYNSQIIDESTVFTQASWVGMGWNLSTGSITYNVTSQTYSIIVGGVSSPLWSIDGTLYNTEDQSFLKVIKGNNAWTVYGKDGTVYTVSNPAMTSFNNGCLPSEQLNVPWKWPLTTEIDRNGNVITYTNHKIKKGTQNQCDNEVDVVPDHITYANGKYRVSFIREIRYDFRLAGENRSNKINYLTERLDKIEIQASTDGTNWTTTRTYDLTYADGGTGQIYPGFNWQPLARTDSYDTNLNHPANPPKGFTATLVNIQEFGSNNNPLPATTFAYADYLHLTEVNNGQGGRVTIGYTPFSFEDDINKNSNGLTDYYDFQDDECYVNGSTTNPTEWKPLVAGQYVACANGRLLVGVQNASTPVTAYRTVPEQLLRVGYPFRFNLKVEHGTSVTGSVEWGIKDKNLETDSRAVSTATLPGINNNLILNSSHFVPADFNPENIQLRLKCQDYCSFYNRLFQFNPTYFQVTSKTVTDDATGKSTTYTYLYDNASPNTEGTSDVVKTNGTTETDLLKYYSLPMMEFRGSGLSQESNSEGLTTMTWYHQSDTLKGKPYHSLVMQKTLYNGLEDSSTTGWTDTTSGTKTFSAMSKVDFDNSMKLTSTTADWNTQSSRTEYSLTDGMTAISHIRLSEAGSSTNEAGMYAGLIHENSTDALGVVVMPDTAIPTGHNLSVLYQINGQSQNAGVLISKEDFQLDKWYVLMLMVDSQNGTRLKIWQEDNPDVQAEFLFPPCIAGNWRYTQKAYKGTTWLDAYIEGRVKSESETRFTAVTQYDTDATNFIPQLGLTESQMALKDISVVWTYPVETTNRTYEKGSRWYGTRENYLYLPEDQNYEQFGNVTRTITSYSDGQEWNYHHATLTKFYPLAKNPDVLPPTPTPTTPPSPTPTIQTTGELRLLSLPARQLTLDCRTGCDFSGRTGVLAETLNFYDDSDSLISRPENGNLTMQRTRINSTGQYAQVNNTYDTQGNVTATTTYTEYATMTGNPSGGARTTSRTYDNTYLAYPLTETNALNQTTTTEYNYALGVPVSVTDPNGSKTGAAYDSLGRMTTVCAPGDWDGLTPCSAENGATLAISYTNFGTGTPAAVHLEQRLDESRSMNFVRFYNGLGKQLQTQTLNAEINGETQNIVVNSIYDTLGRLSRQAKPILYTGDLAYQSQDSQLTDPATVTTYDEFGRVAQVQEPDGSTIKTTYGFMSTTQTDPRAHATTTRTDVWGRVTSVEPEDGPLLAYEYDMLNHLILVTKGSGETATTTSLTYDLAGRKSGMSDPDMGTWGYQYDALGELTDQADARGCTTQITYDALGRPTGKSYGGPCSSTDPVDYFYDGQTFNFFGSSYGSSVYAIGRRTGMIDGSGASVWSYDARGNKASERKMIYTDPSNAAIETFDTQWLYNSADLPVSMGYPDGEVLNLSYNDQGQLDGMENANGFTYLKNLAYDEAGRQRSMGLGSSGQNAVLLRQMNYAGWQQGGRLAEMSTRNLFNVDLQNLRYTYDANGNITTIHDAVNRNEVSSYSYDSLDRLTGETVTGDSYTVVMTETFTYDEAGRLSSKSRDGQATVLGYSPQHPHAVAAYGANTYGYDANGNQVERDLAAGQYTLSYDGENRLVAVVPAGQVTPTATPTPTQTVYTYTPSATASRTTSPGAGPGRYDDTYAGISYPENWNLVNNGGFYQNTYHIAYVGNTKFIFPFNGEKVTWEFFRYNNCGSAEIFLDGVKVDEVGLFSSGLYTAQTWTSPLLEDGSHTLEVRTLVPFLNIDSLTVYAANQSAPAGNIAEPGTYDDSNTKVSYSGAWVAVSDSANYGGGMRHSSAAGDMAFFTFSGEHLTVMFPVTPYGGVTEVYIDGEFVEGINQYSGGSFFRRTWSSPPLADGTHHLMMRTLSGLSYIDALIVSAPEPGYTPTPAGTVVPGGTVEDNAAQVVYTGTWTTYNNTGPSGNNLHYSASAGSSAALSFSGTHVTLVYAGISGYSHADIFIDGTLVTRLNQSTAALTWQMAWVSPLLTAGYHTIRVAYVDGYYNVDAFIVRGLATATPTATAYTPSPTPSRTNTPIPSNTATFTPTATAVPTTTPTPIPSEPSPQALTGAQYAYDGDGTLIRGTINGVTTFYPGRHYNKEVSLSGMVIQKFYFVGTVTIAVRTLTDSADTLNWVLSDHLGSTSTTANENGTLNSVIQYTAFGEIRQTQGNTPTKYRYTGQLAQAELGLSFYVSRFYDPYLNHFIQPDTLIPEPGKSQSFDRYAYVRNNPIKFSDPLGQKWVCTGANQDHCYDDGTGKKSGMIHEEKFTYLETIEQKRTPYSPYMQGWTNFDTAFTIFINPNTSLGDRYIAGNYMSAWGGAHIYLVVGGTILIKETIVASALTCTTNPSCAENSRETTLSVTDKLQRYLLNPEHIEGGSKAKWFEQALGFTRENLTKLAEQIVYDPNKAVPTELTEFGQKFQQVIPIIGANGKIIDVPFIWIQNLDGVIRLVTGIPVKQ